MFWMKKKTPEIKSETKPETTNNTTVAVTEPVAQTFIAESYTIKGRIHGQGAIEVQGRLEGYLDIRGRVSINPTAVMQGEIKAEVVELGGAVEGQLQASQQLTLGPTARLDGSAAAGRIDMAAGARLNGDVQTKP